LTAHLEPLLKKLLKPLEPPGPGSATLSLELVGEDHANQTVRITVSQPTASTYPFMRQINRRLESYRFQSGITDITVSLPTIVSLVSEQLNLTSDTESGSDVTPGHGSQATGQKHPHLYGIVLQPGQLPERGFALHPFPVSRKKDAACSRVIKSPQPYAMRPVSGLRLFSPARAVNVITGSGKLLSLNLRGDTQKVTRQNGPWKLSGEWWNGTVGAGDNNVNGFERLYYEIETARYQAYLLFYDRSSSQWFLQGVFD
jgi:hypothetical protein